jgi:signal transduction histidine kinase
MLWGLTGPDEYFWPIWVWFAICVPLGVHAAVWWALQATPGGAGRALAVHAALTGVLAVVLVVLWLLTGRHGAWPGIALLGPAAALAAHAAGRAVWLRRDGGARELELTERVEELTRTRRGAVEAQAAELQRLERTLHDGAQSRLVTLSMKLGMAETLLVGQPEVAGLLRGAHEETRAAIAELRDLARGIAPPVLTDRGLAAAVAALADRAVGEVTVESRVGRRLAPVVEAAAYLVVCVALANAAEHAPGAAVRVTLALEDDLLWATVADDGPGGADAAGSGLEGARHRVEALDGTLEITSEPGEGTTVRASVPCP